VNHRPNYCVVLNVCCCISPSAAVKQDAYESVVSVTERFVAWCKQEQASLEQQLELMEAGKVRTGEDIGAGWIDTTAESMERAKARLIELHDLLTESGKATVVKPNDL